MEDRSNIIKEAIEYRDKLEKKVEELAQSVVRLQISLDFADNTIKKKDRENAELKAENVNLREKMANIERITREGFKDYYYTYAKNNPFFLNIIKEIEK